MANYAYDSPTMNAAIDVYSSACSIVKAATDSVSSAQHVLSSIASAGGDLGAEIGGTVLGNVKNATSSLQQAMSTVEKVGNALSVAKQIMEGIDSGIAGSAAESAINAIGGNVVFAGGDYSGAVKTIDLIGDIAAEFVPDPIIREILGNAGEMAKNTFRDTDIMKESIIDQNERFSNGEISIGELRWGSATGGVGGTIISAADALLNGFGGDIPDSVVRGITDLSMRGGEAAYRTYNVVKTEFKSWLKSSFPF